MMSYLSHLFIYRASLPTLPTCITVCLIFALVWWGRPRRLPDELRPRRSRKALLTQARAEQFEGAPRYPPLPHSLRDHGGLLWMRCAGRGVKLGRDR